LLPTLARAEFEKERRMGFVAIACLVVYHYGYIHNLVRDHNKLVLDIRDAKSFIAELQEQIESLQPEEEAVIEPPVVITP
jgi:hypothetical protein